jgi:outer membrane protein assembly factor BamB
VRGSTVKESLDFDRRLSLNDGTIALIGQECDRILAFRPGQSNEARLSPMQAPANRPGGEPAGFGKHVLVPSMDGQVLRIDPWTGSVVGAPFQPAVNPNQTIRWARPALFEEQNTFVIGTTAGTLYAVQAEGDASLVRTGQVECPGPIVSPIVRIGDRAYCVCRAEGADRLMAYQVFPQLAEAAAQPLEPQLAGAFAAVDGQLFVETADSKLRCVNADLTAKWQADLPFKLVDAPQDNGNSILVAFDNGDITRLDKATGEVQGTVSLDQPLAGNPFEYNGHWYVNDQQGAVHVVQPIE